MGKRTFSLSGTCGPATLIGVRFDAIRHDENSFNFGRSGLFTLKILDVQLDGRRVQMRSRNRMTTGEETDLIRPDDYLLPHDGQTLALGERLHLQIEAHALIGQDESSVSTEEIKEGRGVFEFRAM